MLKTNVRVQKTLLNELLQNANILHSLQGQTSNFSPTAPFLAKSYNKTRFYVKVVYNLIMAEPFFSL